MSSFKYQMHTHTAPCSRCAPMVHQELVDALVKGGYKGCVLTNHFFGGNTGIDRNLPWNEFVAQYEKDYNECKKIAEAYDLDIIFGIEEHLFGGLEILCYGITPQFLYDHPELRDDHSIETWSNALHNFGALCIQAHPFRERAYIKEPKLLPAEFIDGVEVFNACNKVEENEIIKKIAFDYPNWILVSGADTHLPASVCWSGIKTSTRITDEQTLAKVLKLKDYELII